MGGVDVVRAADLERILEAAPQVYAGRDGDTFARTDHDDATHTARLLCIEPIVRESEERRLLRQALTFLDITWITDSQLKRDIRKLLYGDEK